MEDYIMLVIPFTALDGCHTVFKVYVIAFQQDGLGCPYSELYSKRKNRHDVMRWIAAECHALALCCRKRQRSVQFIVCKGCGV